jgi:hypothetical protein
MRRAISMLVFAALALLPLEAQVRGGRAAGGGFRGGAYHGGAVRGASPFRGAARGYHAAPSYPIGSQVQSHYPNNFAYNWGLHDYDHGRDHDRFHHRRYYGYYYPSYGYTYAYPYYGYPLYDLGFYGDYANNNEQSNAYTQQLANQVNNLSAQMQQLRNENDSLRDYIAEHNRQPEAGPSQSVTPPVSEPSQPQKPSGPPTELVFKDGHTIDAPNYAIVGNTLWVLNDQRAKKIPLSELDLQKTKQLNEQRGVEFTGPPEE